MNVPIISNYVLAEESEQTTAVTREYAVPIQAEYDISKNGDGSLKALWTRSNRTLKISGTGNMKDYSSDAPVEWDRYKHIIENVII